MLKKAFDSSSVCSDIYFENCFESTLSTNDFIKNYYTLWLNNLYPANFTCASNLTDFKTHVVGASSALEMYMKQISYDVTPAMLNYINLTKSLSPEWTVNMSDSLLNVNCERHVERSSTPSNKTQSIWRPFSPEPLQNPTPKYAAEYVNQQHFNVYSSTGAPTFPTITPSTVKIGGTSTSVFKAVKKKKYQCHFCSMSYSNNSQLSGHIRIHTGSKPFRCGHPGCSRAFARNEELTRHRRIHSGYKPHRCHICNKQFGRKDHLNKHCKTHLKASEKKVYLCPVAGCGHRYTRSDALTRHQMTAHSIKHIKAKTSS